MLDVWVSFLRHSLRHFPEGNLVFIYIYVVHIMSCACTYKSCEGRFHSQPTYQAQAMSDVAGVFTVAALEAVKLEAPAAPRRHRKSG